MKKFFLIDDDSIFVFLTKKIMQVVNVSTDITVFEDATKALSKLETLSEDPDSLPDVIFVDLNMPAMDGWGFLKNYLLLEPLMRKKISIYIVSSSISPSELERSKTIPVVTEFLTKPLSRNKFVEIFGTVPA